MRKLNWIGSLKFTGALFLAVVLSAGMHLYAQESAAPSGQQTAPPTPEQQQPQAQPPDQQQQAQPQAQPPAGQAPDAQAPQTQEKQTFTGVVVKSGDRYMLQDSASGTTYDIDRQDLAKPHEGKKVRVVGTLDPNGKLIHVK
ncbi:MAG TPA: DUF5818 domain-containing protein [Terriglobales bacterium]|nr:DUF5818 domain-containing protein [Terriglobales bacterium]